MTKPLRLDAILALFSMQTREQNWTDQQWQCRTTAARQTPKLSPKSQQLRTVTCSTDRSQAGKQEETSCSTTQEGLQSAVSLTAEIYWQVWVSVCDNSRALCLCVKTGWEKTWGVFLQDAPVITCVCSLRNNPNLLNSFTQCLTNRQRGLSLHCLFVSVRTPGEMVRW